MPSATSLTVFLGTALILAIMPGPGLLYIAGRTLGAGAVEGLVSCLGTAVGGSIHVVAAAVGVSALIMASAEAYLVLKLFGGAYLIYLGIQAWCSADPLLVVNKADVKRGRWMAFRQGAIVEATNPKTAAFFLALIPQFIDTSKPVWSQFLVLGSISIILNTAGALVVVWAVSRLRERALARVHLVERFKKASAVLLSGLGVSLLFSRRPV